MKLICGLKVTRMEIRKIEEYCESQYTTLCDVRQVANAETCLSGHVNDAFNRQRRHCNNSEQVRP
jgi:hypothetical protein